jgi:uncharacterized membrane protein YphA (DoxX/SURF4 family)
MSSEACQSEFGSASAQFRVIRYISLAPATKVEQNLSLSLLLRPLASLAIFATAAEILFGLLLVLGRKTRIAALLSG